jgi:rubredoxin
VGYFLSVINALVFAFPIPLLYPALASYPTSILLRGYGWRSLRGRLGTWGVLYLPIWVLGGATYAAILLQLGEIINFGVYLALACWTAYSVAESLLYLRAAKTFKARPLFLSPISLVGVAIIASIAIMPSSILSAPAGGAPLISSPLILVATGMLVASAIITALKTMEFRATPKELGSGIGAVGISVPRPRRSEASVTRPQAAAQTPPTEATMKLRGPLIRIEIISRSDSMLCSNCGESAPVGTDRCGGCGTPFKKASSGLRCPVCKAPFSAVKMVARGHYVCGQCFSDLRIS